MDCLLQNITHTTHKSDIKLSFKRKIYYIAQYFEIDIENCVQLKNRFLMHIEREKRLKELLRLKIDK